MANRLAREASPYLRQHADNPVDWWPWGDAAFAEARRRDVPVFLSIGYATCHWCHVMAHESFEDDGVAKAMNEAFVCIKVDREERPDVDDVHMAVCQMMTGSGGWPLNVLLTPDRLPFFAGTYFPKSSRFGRIGMLELVPKLAQAWKTGRSELEGQAQHIVAHLRGEAHEHNGEHHGAADRKSTGPPGASTGAGDPQAPLSAAAAAFAKRFDPKHGGFGRAPKFPSPHNLVLLLRLHRRGVAPQAMAMVEATLDAMAAGGIHDHVGGGFHRYSTDAHWLLPHFEKMLYDQAMLAMAYTEAFEATGHARHATVARDILDYVLRDLQDRAGGFHSAEDADSEGVEGKFYVWSKAELVAALGKEEADLVCASYGVAAEGNFHDEATHQLTGANILHIPRPLDQVATARALSRPQLEERLARARKTLLATRAQRIRPLLDDKVLTDWNGLAIAAFAKAGRALGEPRYTQAAVTAARFLLGTMRLPDGKLRHRFHHGTVDAHSFLHDHAFLLWGLLELHETTQHHATLQTAIEVAQQATRRFAHPGGGFYATASDGEAILARRREAYDGALPSGNSTLAAQLVRLSRLTGDSQWEAVAAATFDAFQGELAATPHGVAMMLCGLDAALGPAREVFISAGPGQADLLAVARRGYRPRDVLVVAASDADSAAALAAAAPWTKDLGPVGGRAAAYVCTGHACQRPVTEPEALAAALR